MNGRRARKIRRELRELDARLVWERRERARFKKSSLPGRIKAFVKGKELMTCLIANPGGHLVAAYPQSALIHQRKAKERALKRAWREWGPGWSTDPARPAWLRTLFPGVNAG